MLNYTFAESYHCAACGGPLDIDRVEAEGRETRTFLKPCSKCLPVVYGGLVSFPDETVTGWLINADPE